ncbi:MAG: imelysin family protein [Polyangiaceae bacterium]|nr:imelysin family protein [Myxococcales bacterium]MCB9589229.1 imelysin family protein [Polyangiaceae bacterium]
MIQVRKATLGLIAAICVWAGCRKPPPDEHVYSGQIAPPTGAGGSANAGAGGAPGTGGGWTLGGTGGALDAGPDAGEHAALSCQLEAEPESFSKSALLASIAQCALTRYEAHRQAALELQRTTQAFAAEPSDVNALSAQNAWRKTISSWQRAELFRFGPAARSGEPGAQDLRDQIYGWPLVSRCKVDEQLVSQDYTKPEFASSLINGRTHSALDYLLFYPGTDNGCSSFSAINANGSWSALGAAELRGRKAAYAGAVSSLVLTSATRLVEFWVPTQDAFPEGKNFCSTLATAGNGSGVFDSDQAALNAVSDALFYVDKELKDWKLGRPVGLVDCFAEACPEAVELPYSKGSLAHIANNLVGFRDLFEGCTDSGLRLGFDDWLIAVGAESVSQRMLSALDGAQLELGKVPGPLDAAVTSDKASVERAYAAVKQLTDILKTEFVTVLNLELPKSAEGDND